MSSIRVALGIAAPLLLGLAGCVVTPPQREVVVEHPREQVVVTRPAPVVVERPVYVRP